MNFNRRHLAIALVTAALVMLASWIARHSEWVEETVDAPPSSALREDPLLRLKRLLMGAGATVATPENLDKLPPEGATLVLDSLSWDLFPETAVSLRRWVEAGGALVLPDFDKSEAALAWVPIEIGPASTGADSDEPPDPPSPTERGPCPSLDEPPGTRAAFEQARAYDTCMDTSRTLRSASAASWALDGAHGHVVLRVPVGRGSVTAIPVQPPWRNERLLERDHALLAIAITQARPGRVIWIVSGEARPPLPIFLWKHGTPAILLGGVALAFALWRGATRFGPRIAPLPPVRRSMSEQVRGTARFLASRGSTALHQAQLRALHEAARKSIRGFDPMPCAERIQAIAEATRLDPGALAAALDPGAAKLRHPAPALALLETARRRLLATRPGRSL